MECDQTRQVSIDGTSNMHGRQDGMGDGPCKGGDTKIPNVLDLSESCYPLYTRARCSKLLTTLILMNNHVVPIFFLMNFCFSYKNSFSLLIIVHHPQCTMQRASLKSWAWNTILSMHAKWGAYCIGVFMWIFKDAQNAIPLDTNK